VTTGTWRGRKFYRYRPKGTQGKENPPKIEGKRAMETEMTTNHDDFTAKAAAIDAKWREHLATWAVKELRRRGLHMDPDGKIRPAARVTRDQAARGANNGALR
jgi:hypothetical protein